MHGVRPKPSKISGILGIKLSGPHNHFRMGDARNLATTLVTTTCRIVCKKIPCLDKLPGGYLLLLAMVATPTWQSQSDHLLTFLSSSLQRSL
jgi:hypothetical protein